MKLLVVGVSGPSSSGKSTVVKGLVSVLPHCSEIHLDDFYFPDSQIPVDAKHGVQNWDCADALDWHRFKEHMKCVRDSCGNALPVDSLEIDLELVLKPKDADEMRVKIGKSFPGLETCHVVLVDGFMLFHDASVADCFDVKLLFRAPHATLKARRELRQGYNTVEGFWADPPGYFDNIVWPAYIDSHKHLFTNEDVESSLSEVAKKSGIHDLVNDGSRDLPALVWAALEVIAGAVKTDAL